MKCPKCGGQVISGYRMISSATDNTGGLTSELSHHCQECERSTSDVEVQLAAEVEWLRAQVEQLGRRFASATECADLRLKRMLLQTTELSNLHGLLRQEQTVTEELREALEFAITGYRNLLRCNTITRLDVHGQIEDVIRHLAAALTPPPADLCPGEECEACDRCVGA